MTRMHDHDAAEPASLLASALRRRGSENGAAHSPTGREIKTRSGLMIDVTRPDLFDPRDGDGMLADIAWSLSGITRYGGHSPNTVSVAAHSIRLVREYKALASATPGDVAWAGRVETDPLPVVRALLLHDAAESICSDLSSAGKWYVRQHTNAYDTWEDAWSDRIMERYRADATVLESDAYAKAHATVTELEFTAWDAVGAGWPYDATRAAVVELWLRTGGWR